ncbi:MAG: bla regulator protein blaR1 [Acidobacteriaceae bacterium]|jgi:beta-lactamase regulating signal transducer with metallopeptidase domain|nr:bla regulator protein blaR1 [Acidobacteriaceae bacterium]
MNPDLLLDIVAALAGFVLKTTLAFAVCLALSRLAGSPTRRFMVWLAFLYGTTAYWLWMANQFLAGGQMPAGTLRLPVQPVTSTAGALQIPGSWAVPMGVAFRVIGIAYLLALACILLTHFKRQRQLRWVLRFTTKPPDEIAAVFQSIAESLHVGRSKLLVLSGAASPATFGWIRPIILLPHLCLQQDRSELEDILRHELHHVRRWDFLWNGFAVLCRALLFFHPAAWYALRKIQFDRELACDLAVISDSPARRAEYAECLIHFARLNSSQDPRAWGIDFAASSEHLKARVQSILAGANRPSRWLFGLRMGFGLALLAAFTCVVPSLAVLPSYAHQQTFQPSTTALAPSHSEVATRVQTTRKRRLSTPSVRTSSDPADASVSQAEPAPSIATLPEEHKSDAPSSAQSRPPLQLLHRTSPSAGNPAARDVNGVKQQKVVFVDDDSDQVTKAGARDKAQTLQQSATAVAGIYRRLAEVDRH